MSLVFALIVLGALDPRPVQQIFDARHPAESDDFPRFLQEVARRTERGDTIAIEFGVREWVPGYMYAFRRAAYFLSGRRVIPLVDPDDSQHPERLRDVTYVAVWGTAAPAGSWERVWSGHGGALLRRTR